MVARVLIVEDEALVALDVARQLTEAGLTIVGPAVSVASALKLIEQGGCDAAVLDINLGRETSDPVVQELAKDLGLKARAYRTSWNRLAATPLPGIAPLRDGSFLFAR
jgi:DNA-binding NarL/FixJ family response regulator